MAYEPLHHKYRPQTFAELVGQEAIATTLTNALRQQRIAPAYLFTGARGTGKTSSARILAKSLNCLSSPVPTEKPCGVCEVCRSIANGSALDVIEIDAASNTGVDNIRELIERSQFAPVQCRYKVYVVDECHMLSTAAFNALLKTLEEPPDRVVFVLATTDPQRVLPTIISRCQRFDFRRIPLGAMVKHLSSIAAQETINISAEAVQLVAQISQGGLRDAESLLDQLSLLEGQVTPDRVWELVGAVPERELLDLVRAIAGDEATTVIDTARHLMDRGREPLTVLQNLASFYRDLLIAKTTPDRLDLVAITAPTWSEVCQFVEHWDIYTILAGQQRLRESEVQVKHTTQPRLWLEVTLMGLLPSAQRTETAPSSHQPLAASPRQAAAPSPRSIASQPAEKTPSTPKAASEESLATAEAIQHLQEGAIEPVPTVSNGHTASGHQNGGKNGGQNHHTESLEPLDQPDRVVQRTVSAASVAPQVDLEQIWNDMIAQLQPPGTQTLLRQQGCLLGFEGQQARVGISSQPLFKMAQNRIPNVEAAFEKLYGRKIRVSLEVATASKPPVLSPEQAPTQLSASPLPPIVKEAVPEFHVPPVEALRSIPEPSPPEPSRPAPSRPEPSRHEAVQHPSLPATPVVSELSIGSWQEEDDVSKAAKSVAQMFNGQIVSAENEIQAASTTDLILSPEATLSEIDLESEPDEDVPF